MNFLQVVLFGNYSARWLNRVWNLPYCYKFFISVSDANEYMNASPSGLLLTELWPKSTHIWTPPFCKLFLFDCYDQLTQLLPYIRPINEVFAASGPDGFPHVFISIILSASKAHALNGFLKTPA